MRKFRFLAVITLAALSVSVPAFATPTAEITIEPNFRINANSVGPTYVYNKTSGVVKKIDDSGVLVEVATGWPELPSGVSHLQPISLHGTTSGTLFASAHSENFQGQTFLWISYLDNSGWANWIQIHEENEAISSLDVSDVSQSNSVFAFVYKISFDSGAAKTYLASNYSGNWATLLIADTSAISTDVLYPNNPITTSNLRTSEPIQVKYFVPNSNGWMPISISGKKVALIGVATFPVEEVVSQGNSFLYKKQMFSQLIDISSMTPLKRTLGGSAQYFAPGSNRLTIGGENIYESNAWWNPKKTNIVFTGWKFANIECPPTQNGANEIAFTEGSCYYRDTLVQFADGVETVLAQNSARFGEGLWEDFEVLQTDDGLVGMYSTWHREVSVDGLGQMTGWLNDKAHSSFTWVKPDKNLEFSEIEFTESEKSAVSAESWHNLVLHRGIAMDVNGKCSDSEADLNPDCKIELKFFGEGKSKTFATKAKAISTASFYGSFRATSTGNNLLLVSDKNSYNETNSGWTFEKSITPNFFNPKIKKLKPSMRLILKNLKLNKSNNLPVVSMQKHPISWKVLKSSKGICSIKSTLSVGEINKISVKGLKPGVCALSAKTTNGFFYKTLDETVKVLVK